MLQGFESVYLFAAVLVVVVTGIVEMIKLTFPKMPKNYVPVMAFVVGILLGIAGATFTHLGIEERIWAGAFAGLAATGLFELAFNPRAGQVKDK